MCDVSGVTPNGVTPNPVLSEKSVTKCNLRAQTRLSTTNPSQYYTNSSSLVLLVNPCPFCISMSACLLWGVPLPILMDGCCLTRTCDLIFLVTTHDGVNEWKATERNQISKQINSHPIAAQLW